MQIIAKGKEIVNAFQKTFIYSDIDFDDEEKMKKIQMNTMMIQKIKKEGLIIILQMILLLKKKKKKKIILHLV